MANGSGNFTGLSWSPQGEDIIANYKRQYPQSNLRFLGFRGLPNDPEIARSMGIQPYDLSLNNWAGQPFSQGQWGQFEGSLGQTNPAWGTAPSANVSSPGFSPQTQAPFTPPPSLGQPTPGMGGWANFGQQPGAYGVNLTPQIWQIILQLIRGMIGQGQ